MIALDELIVDLRTSLGQRKFAQRPKQPSHRHRLRDSVWVHRALRGAEKMPGTRRGNLSVTRQLEL